MRTVPFALYDAFSDVAFGGSQAAVFGDAAGFDGVLCEKIAKEMGMPASAFVSEVSGNKVTARFQSTVMELPMCGHGTICLMTRLVEDGALEWGDDGTINVELALPGGAATVTISRRPDGRPLVMLDIIPSTFRNDGVDETRLAALLGVGMGDFSSDLTIETACADFIHLVVPMKNLEAMHRIAPDFPGLIALCDEHGIETIAAFSTEVERAGNTLHVRDFCPAVGVWELSSAGTTNGALACYLIRHNVAGGNKGGYVEVLAEQGMEIGRASSIRSIAHLNGDNIERLQVGGVATKIIDGQMQLPDHITVAGV